MIFCVDKYPNNFLITYLFNKVAKLFEITRKNMENSKLRKERDARRKNRLGDSAPKKSDLFSKISVEKITFPP